jgi:hypothetical protein
MPSVKCMTDCLEAHSLLVNRYPLLKCVYSFLKHPVYVHQVLHRLPILIIVITTNYPLFSRDFEIGKLLIFVVIFLSAV